MVDFQRDVFCLLGLPFDAVDTAAALEKIRDAAARRIPCFLSTPNTNWVVNCLDDEPFRNSAIHSDLSIVDGMPLVWIARLLGIPIREPVPGSTVFERLRRKEREQISVFFFGGSDGAAEAACRRLRIENQGLTCRGFESAGFGSIEEMSDDRIIARINASNADFLVVALGARKGQAWIERNRARLTVPIISHLGAVMNFVAGTVKRAPSWMQRHGLEWLWRIKEEPSLWVRYFRDGLTLMGLLATRVLPHAWLQRRSRSAGRLSSSARIDTQDECDAHVIVLSGAWTRENLARLRECFGKAVLSQKDVRLDLRATTHVDSWFVGLAILLQGYQRLHNRELHVVGAQGRVRRVIKYCCAEYLLVCAPSRRPATSDGTLQQPAMVSGANSR